MTRTLLASLLVLFGSVTLVAQSAIFGTVTDEDGEPVIGGNVAVYNGTSLVTGTQTDFDGNYRIDIDPGTYNVEFSYVGYDPLRIEGYQVLVGKENKLDNEFQSGVTLGEVTVVAYKVPVMNTDETTQGTTLTSTDVKQLGTRSINAIATVGAGATSSDEGDAVSIRGGRTNATQYVVDGIRVTGQLPPETEIEQIQVVTGGVEAKYGDLSSGLINITTKGPSSQFRGYVEGETSQFLDPYNNNLVGVSLSGPIAKRTLEDGSKQSIVGYRFSGRYTYREDDDPPATDIFYITDEARQRLENQPIRSVEGGSTLPEAGYLSADDVQVLDAQPFEDFERLDITGKIDARLSPAIDLTLTGNYADQSDRFTPGEGSRTEDNWRLLNAHNNPYDLDDVLRGNFRFRHRLGAQGGAQDTSNLISNALYTVQLGWQRRTELLQDTRHEDRFFDYGYIGNFDIQSVPAIDTTFTFDPIDGVRVDVNHIGYREDFRGYTSGNVNPVLANYNKLGLENTEGIRNEDIIARNGNLSRLITDGVYSLHSSIGSIYNRFEQEKNDLITFNLQTQFDLRPARGKAGTHNIQLGFLYEQRINRRYVILPRNLWTTARALANNPLQGIDTNVVLRVDTAIVQTPQGQQIVPYNVYQYNFDEAALGRDSRFFNAVRANLPEGPLDFVNVDGLTPDQLSIDMFSAPEATQDGNILYYGYDYTGREVTANSQWDDFFTARNAEGQRTFPVAPIQPIYAAGYIQDKFNFRNIILRAGVRVDYFDANTKVLKDPYELYDVQTVANFNFDDDFVVPANISPDAKVYLENAGGTAVKAFREGDVWFTADGRQVNRASEIFTSTQNPAFVDERAYPAPDNSENTEIQRGQNYIRSVDFDPNASFEDYQAQINFMPRLAFSFPISDDANFFAHYDVLVQRPPSNTVATALDYYYWFDNISQSGYVANNPNLAPTRTVDYEAGFQQRITQSSALKLSFFVREMRDMIQRRTYLFSMGSANSYTTYDNQDFGTVKGLNVSYDLRRTGPVSLRLNYGLQFADGTGSDADSQSGGSLQRGNLRTLYPLSFDERHRISGSIDYRYGINEGPEIFGARIFENTGVNLFGSAVSGRPYTRQIQATQLSGRGNDGDINGARLPWNIALNARVDRNFSLFNENGRGVDLNVYLRVSNVLDRRNIISVYPATGSPSDDGFLVSPTGSTLVSNQLDQEAFVRSYQYRVLNPNFFSLPRRFFLGASVSF